MAGETGTGMKKRRGAQAASPGPARSGPPPAAPGRQDERRDHGGHPEGDRESGLAAYVTRLVDDAPLLTDEQRDTLALLLRRPRRSQALNGCVLVMTTVPGRRRCGL